MKKLILAMIFFIPAVTAVRINEIMYDPSGNEYDFEYLELYSEELEDISGYYFDGITFTFPQNTTLEGYLVIANTKNDTGTNNDFNDKYNKYTSFEFDGSLSNSGETLTLYDKNGNIIDSVQYGDSADEDYSLEFYQGSFLQSLILQGTPGMENSHYNDSVVLENTVSTNCTGSIVIDLSNDFLENGETLEFKPIVETSNQNYVVEYYITDLSNNLKKSKLNTTNTNIKSYTPSIQESDEVFKVFMNLFLECSPETYSKINSSNATFYVYKYISNIPQLEIKEIYLGDDTTAKFGQKFDVRITANKGNSSKSKIDVF